MLTKIVALLRKAREKVEAKVRALKVQKHTDLTDRINVAWIQHSKQNLFDGWQIR